MRERTLRHMAINRRGFLRVTMAAILAPIPRFAGHGMVRGYVEAVPASRYPGPLQKITEKEVKIPGHWAG